MTWNDSSIRIINKKTTLRRSRVAKKLIQALRDYGANGGFDQRPLLGIYSCLICERHFSTKHQLKRHYCRRHQDTIPNFTGLYWTGNESFELEGEVSMRSTLPVVLALLLALSAILAVSGAATVQTHVLHSIGNSPSQTNNISTPNSNGSQSQVKLTPQSASAGPACADDCQQDT